jgi:hypothetical protein
MMKRGSIDSQTTNDTKADDLDESTHVNSNTHKLEAVIVKTGVLQKQGGSWKSWKARWMVLIGSTMCYFENDSENKAKGVIYLDKTKIKRVSPTKYEKNYVFEIEPPDQRRTYVLQAETQEEEQEWVTAITKAIKWNAKVEKLIQVCICHSIVFSFLFS